MSFDEQLQAFEEMKTLFTIMQWKQVFRFDEKLHFILEVCILVDYWFNLFLGSCYRFFPFFNFKLNIFFLLCLLVKSELKLRLHILHCQPKQLSMKTPAREKMSRQNAVFGWCISYHFLISRLKYFLLIFFSL